MQEKNTKYHLVAEFDGSWSAAVVSASRNLYKILGEAIRVQRIKLGFSQEQLAEKAGVARNYIGNIERAEHKVTLETLARIAKALKLRVSDLTRDL